MATSWLDLMGDDSNISMASMASMASLECENKSRLDPDFDHSQQGVNLLFKKNIKIISDDSQSRKRRFKSIDNINDENANCLPPKAKQRTNDKGHWMKRKDIICKNAAGPQDFSRFLNWAKTNDSNKGSAVLGAKSFDSKRNVMKNMVVCGPSIKNQSARRRQFRGRRQTKKELETMNESKSNSQSPTTTVKEIECLDEEMKTNNDEIDDDDDELNEKGAEREEMEEDDDIDVRVKEAEAEAEDNEDEDDDLKQPYVPRKKRRSTPILENIVFNKELMLSKVPILKKKTIEDESSKFIKNVPIFLNADEYEELKENEVKKANANANVSEEECEKEESKSEECGVWGSQSLVKESKDECTRPKTWAHKLFGSAVRANKVLTAQENERLVEEKKRERLHQIKIESILPTPRMNPIVISRESSVVSLTSPSSANQYETSPAPTSTTTTTTTTTTSTSSVCKPSAEAIEWRAKQIKLGKQTDGYLNFIKIYPNKDLRFRLSNNLISTPTKNERIGKKRWVGKYKKWRQFLHKFDEIEQEQQ